MRAVVHCWVCGLSGLLLVLGGCVQRDMQDLQHYVAQVKSREPGRIKPLPEVRPIETFAYNAGGRRDPFKPAEQTTTQPLPVADNGIAPDPMRRKEELESFPLDSLRMVGTLDKGGITWALVTTQDGTIYRVRVGNYMGQNNGRITQIAEDRIELAEIVPDSAGGYRERQAVVALSE